MSHAHFSTPRISWFCRIAGAMALVVVSGLAFEVRAGGPATLPLVLDGVLGDRVELGSPQQKRTTVVIFMSRRSKDASSGFARSIDEKLLNGPVESVGIVDVRKYSGLMRRLAQSYLRKSAEESRSRRRDRRTAAGIDASAEFVNRWHLVGDFDGSLFARFGVDAEPDKPLAFVLSRDGSVRGPYRDVDALLRSVAEATTATATATR
jgi:hypothetical protein